MRIRTFGNKIRNGVQKREGKKRREIKGTKERIEEKRG
jgi:hypothetical protein